MTQAAVGYAVVPSTRTRLVACSIVEAMATQTGCAMAIELGIAAADQQPTVAARLADLVRSRDGRIGTGFLGTPLVLPALVRWGHHAEAYRLLLNEKCPGWLYQIRNGATTTWERWDAVKEDGTVLTDGLWDGPMMTSFNHYSYGSVSATLYRSVAGLAPDVDRPGYEHILFAPLPGGGLTTARADVETPYGEAAVSWRLEADTLTVDATVPPGAQGSFVSPPGWVLQDCTNLAPICFGSGRHRFTLRPQHRGV